MSRLAVDLSDHVPEIEAIAEERERQKKGFESTRGWNENTHFIKEGLWVRSSEVHKT